MIKVSINNICAKLTECEPLVAGMIGKTLDVELSAEWNNYEKTAVFSNGDKTVDVLESEWNGNIIKIPWEVLETPNRAVSFGIYGYTKNGDDIILAIPTLYTSLGRVYLGTNPDGDESTDPSLPVWAQIQTEVDDLDDRVTYLEEHGGGGSDLPEVTEADNGKVLKVVDGEWAKGNDEGGAGWTDEQIDLLEAVFEKLVYTDAEGGAIAAQLIDSLRGGVVPEEPITITFDGTKAVISGLGNTTITYSGSAAKIGYMPL